MIEKKKKRQKRKPYILLSIILFLIVLLSALIAFNRLNQVHYTITVTPEVSVEEHLDRLRQAQAIWRRHDSDNYRFTISYLGYYSVSYLVKEGVSNLESSDFENPFRPPPNHETILHIFDDIERILEAKACEPNGCQCDGYHIADAYYDETYGYPVSVRDCLSRLGIEFQGSINCHLIGFEGVNYDITSFELIDS